jgi:hypothetical protein
LKPPEFDENDNDGMSRWLGALEALAEELGAYLVLVHHVGHGDRGEAHTAGRGASSIAAVAQAAWLLEDAPSDPRCRRLKIRGNAVMTRELLLEVAPEESDPGAILYFRPTDPLDRYEIDDLLGSEAISTTELSRRLAPGSEPGGAEKRTARRLRDRWERAGLIEVVGGPRGSILLRRVADQTTGPRADHDG